jgi:hypothetical protein
MKTIVTTITAATMLAGMALVAIAVGERVPADRIRDRTGTAGGHRCDLASQSKESQPLAAAGSLDTEREGLSVEVNSSYLPPRPMNHS